MANVQCKKQNVKWSNFHVNLHYYPINLMWFYHNFNSYNKSTSNWWDNNVNLHENHIISHFKNFTSVLSMTHIFRAGNLTVTIQPQKMNIILII